jgi:hypothetical protein
MENISIEKLIEENKLLKEKINELTEHLKKYTAPKRNKKFYENHKEEIIKKVMEYKEKNKDKKQDSEKIKEYNRRAYLKRKEKNTKNS